MPRTLPIVPLLAVLLLPLPSSAAAQSSAPRWSVAAGYTRLPSGSSFTRNFGGSLSAMHAQLAGELAVRGNWSLQLTGHAILPLEQRVAVPGCIPDGGGCFSSSTPDQLFGASVLGVHALGHPTLRGSLGGGFLTGPGTAPAPVTSATLEGGVEWRPLPSRRATLLLGVRGLLLARHIGDMPAIVLPYVGVGF